MAENSLTLTSMENGVFRLTLNNPDRRNALSIEMLNAIKQSLSQAEADQDARVIVISANGPVFCSGHDLKEMSAARKDKDRGAAFFEKTMKLCSSMMMQIVTHRLPVIAEVDGAAAAAGCQIVASCDLAVAGANSSFITPGVNIGLFCSTPMVALSRNVTAKHAMEMLLTGEAISAETAERFGLINRAVKADQLKEATEWFTSRIIAKSAATLKIGKKAYYNQAEMTLNDAYEYCSNVMVENMLQRDAEEGINAFLEKRQPVWKDE